MFKQCNVNKGIDNENKQTTEIQLSILYGIIFMKNVVKYLWLRI